MSQYVEGQRVRHVNVGVGKVIKVDKDGTVHVEFEGIPWVGRSRSISGKPPKGEYSRQWFEIHGHLLSKEGE